MKDIFDYARKDIINIGTNNYYFWLNVRKVEDCLFSRREGHSGIRIFGYSIRINAFGKEIL